MGLATTCLTSGGRLSGLTHSRLCRASAALVDLTTFSVATARPRLLASDAMETEERDRREREGGEAWGVVGAVEEAEE